MKLRHLALLIPIAAGLTLTACGGSDDDNQASDLKVTSSWDGPAVEGITDDMRNNNSVTTAPDPLGGFDTPKDRENALTVYACHLMATTDPADVYRAASNEVLNNPILEASLAPTETEKKFMDATTTVAEQRKKDFHATCDESDPTFLPWAKIGWAHHVDNTMEFDKQIAEDDGVFNDPQYQREVDGTAVGLTNPHA